MSFKGSLKKPKNLGFLRSHFPALVAYARTVYVAMNFDYDATVIYVTLRFGRSAAGIDWSSDEDLA